MDQTHLLNEAKVRGYNLGICARVVNDNGDILLLQRSSHDFCPGVWEMPGGGVEEGESLLEALARELREEAGITKIIEAHYVEYFDFHNEETGKTKRKFCYQVKTKNAIKLSSEHSDYHYFSYDELLKLRVEGVFKDFEIFKDHFSLLIK